MATGASLRTDAQVSQGVHGCISDCSLPGAPLVDVVLLLNALPQEGCVRDRVIVLDGGYAEELPDPRELEDDLAREERSNEPRVR